MYLVARRIDIWPYGSALEAEDVVLPNRATLNGRFSSNVPNSTPDAVWTVFGVKSLIAFSERVERMEFSTQPWQITRHAMHSFGATA